MSILLDTGALLAVEVGDRELVAIIKREQLVGRAPITHGGVIGQVWRGGGPRQAQLARLLPGLDIEAIDEGLGRRAGTLLAQSKTSDVIDASLVVLAQDGDELFTSDSADLRELAAAADLHVDIIPI